MWKQCAFVDHLILLLMSFPWTKIFDKKENVSSSIRKLLAPWHKILFIYDFIVKLMTKLPLRLHCAFTDRVNNVYHFPHYSNFPVFCGFLSLQTKCFSGFLLPLFQIPNNSITSNFDFLNGSLSPSFLKSWDELPCCVIQRVVLHYFWYSS